MTHHYNKTVHLAVIGLTALIVACTTQPVQSTATPLNTTATPAVSDQLQPTVALIVGLAGDPFYVTMERGAQAAADEFGVTLIVDGPA